MKKKDLFPEFIDYSELPQERATEEDYADFLSKYDLDEKKEIRFRNCYRIAIAVSAAAVVAFFVATGIFFKRPTESKYSNIIANNSPELMLHTLPDGSRIGLSPNSEIKYSNEFNTRNRKVILRGTCYFDITKNRELPFEVIPKNSSKEYNSKKSDKRMVIEVTGTKFYTTTASSDSDLLEIALKEGSVSVRMCRNGEKQVVSLSQGDYFEVTKDMSPVKSPMVTHDLSIMDAMASYLRFRETKLSDIVNKLSIVHNRTFTIMNDEIAELLLTADFMNNSIEEILLIFKATMDVNSSINKNGVIELY